MKKALIILAALLISTVCHAWDEDINNRVNNGAVDDHGKYYAPAGNGVVDPQNGTYYQGVGGGYVNTRTGEFVPAN